MELLFLLLAFLVVFLTVRKAIVRSRKVAELQHSLDSLNYRSEEVEVLTKRVLEKLDNVKPEFSLDIFDMAAQDAMNACKAISRSENYNKLLSFFEYHVNLERESADILDNLAVYYDENPRLNDKGLSYLLKDEFWLETVEFGGHGFRNHCLHPNVKGVKRRRPSVDRSLLQNCFSEVGSYAS